MPIERFTKTETVKLPSPWITPATAAKLVGVSRQAMHRRASLGHIRTNRIDGRLFVHKDDVVNIKPRQRKMTDKVRIHRDTQIIELYRQGQTLQAIGDQFGVSRERVRQILDKQGVEKRPRPEGVVRPDHAADLRRFVDLAERVVTQLENDRAVDLQPGPKTIVAFKEAIRVAHQRLNLSKKAHGRPLIDLSQSKNPKNTESMRRLRDKRRQEAAAAS